MSSDHVFLSHSSANKRWAEALAKNLVANGVEVFLDKWDIAGGDRWVKTIEDATAQSRAAVIVLTAESSESGWVRDEYDRFKIEQNTKGSDFRIVPILLEPKTPKFEFLKTLQHVDFTDPDRYEIALGVLLAALRGDPPGPDPQPATVVEHPHAKPVSVPATATDAPPPPATLTGRQKEIADAVEAIESSDGLMLHGLKGMGGIGKTVLARAAAAKLKARFPKRVEINLRGAADAGAGPPVTPEAAMAAVLRWYGVQDRLPDNLDELAQLYQRALADVPALLLLDSASNATQVAPLLPHDGSRSAAIVTTRLTFDLKRKGMRFCEVGLLSDDDAVALAREHCSSLTDDQATRLAVSICGCLPLAIEIAASGIDVQIEDLGVDEMLADLEQRKLRAFADLQEAADGPNAPANSLVTLHTSIAWSMNALDDEDREAFVDLSVFPGDFDAIAAAAVWGELSEDTVAAAKRRLGRLRRASLLLLPEREDASRAPRYALHDLVRTWAAERVARTEEQPRALRTRFVRHFLSVLETARQLYLGGKVVEALSLYDHEAANIGAAFGFAIADGDHESVIAIVNAGAYVMDLRQTPHDRIEWTSAQRDAARANGHKEAEVAALGNLGVAHADLGDARRAIEFYEQALVIAREIGDRRGEGSALGSLGIAYKNLGDARKAIEFYKQHLDIAREIGDRRGEGNALGNLGNAHAELGDERKAIEFYEQYLSIAREIGDRVGEGNALGNIGSAHDSEGRGDEAMASWSQAIEIYDTIGARAQAALTRWNLGAALAEAGRREEARPLLQTYVDYLREIGHAEAEAYAEKMKGLLGNS